MRYYLTPILLFFLCMLPSLGRGQSVTVEIGNVFSPKDSTVCVPIIVDFSNTPDGVNGLDFYISFDPAVLEFIGDSNAHPDVEGLIEIKLREGFLDVLQVSWFDFDFSNSLFINDTLICLEFVLSGEGCTDLNFIFDTETTEIVNSGAEPISGVVFSNGSVCESPPRELILEVFPDSITTQANPQGGGTYFRDYVIDISVEEVEGFEFIGWEAENPDYQQYIADPTSLATTFTMPPDQGTSDIILTAVYEAIKYSVTINIVPDPIVGDPNPQGEGEDYLFQQPVTISVEELEGYTFVGWEVDWEDFEWGVYDPETDREISFLMPSRDLEFTATYEPIPYSLTLLVNPDEIKDQADPGADPENPHGYPDPMTYHIGDEITLSTQDVVGYDFVDWITSDPDHQNLISDFEALQTTFTMPADDVTITATYELTKYTITLIVDPPEITDDAEPAILFDNPHGDPPDNIHFRMGDEVGISVSEVEGYFFVGWEASEEDIALLGEGNEWLNPDPFTMPPRNLEFIAVFAHDEFELILRVSPEMITSMAEPQTDPDAPYGNPQIYRSGDNVNISVNPSVTGYRFREWWHPDDIIRGLIENPLNAHTNITMPKQDIELWANFDKLVTLTISIVGNGEVEVWGRQYIEPEIFTAGEVVNLKPLPFEGESFVDWSGDFTSTNPGDVQFVIDSDMLVTATFTYPEPPVVTHTLTIGIEGDGSVVVDGEPYQNPITYTDGSNPVLEAIPANSNWYFDVWSGDPVNSPGAANTWTLMDASKTITATFAERTTDSYTLNVVVVGEGEVSVGGELYRGTVLTEINETVTLEAFSDQGWQFDGWSGDLDGNDNPADLLMDDNKTVTATFSEIGSNTYTLTINTQGSGTVMVNDQAYSLPLTFDEGSEPLLEAMPNEGWQFDGWSGDMSGTINPQSLSMDGNKTVTATFSEIAAERFSLTVNIEGDGLVLANGASHHTTFTVRVDEGTSFNLESIADEGWQFDGWSGDLTGEDPSQTLVIDDNKTVTATFSLIQYTLTVDAGDGGQVMVNGFLYDTPLTFYHGESPDLEAIADEGWQFDGWSGDLADADPSHTLFMDDNKTVTATFSLKQYTLTIVAGDGGQVMVDGSPYENPLTFYHGESPELESIADEGWQFDGWSGDLTGADPSQTLIMDDNKIVTATFSLIQYTLTIVAGDGGHVLVDGSPYEYPLTFYHGESPMLLAIPNEYWQFDGWSGDLSGNENPESILMNEDQVVEAIFTQNIFTLTVDIIGEGIVRVDGVDYTEPVTRPIDSEALLLAALPDTGWQFIEWSGDHTSNNEITGFYLTRDMHVTAVFEEIPPPPEYTLTILIEGQGSVSLNGAPYTTAQNFVEGSTVSLVANPVEGWQFDSWSGDLSGEDLSQYATMDSDKTITAIFSIKEYTLTVVTNEGGQVMVDGSPYIEPLTLHHGETVQLLAASDEGWQFDGWSGDLEGTDAQQDILMNSDKLVTAGFSQKEFTITFVVMDQNGILINDATIRFSGESYPPGTYIFEQLFSGSYDYSVSREGFLNSSGTATIIDDDIEVTVVLETDPSRTRFLIVYPNPANALLTIETNESFSGVEVYNAMGKIMLTASFDDRLKHTIEVGHFASGMYFVSVFSDNQIRTAKFEVIK